MRAQKAPHNHVGKRVHLRPETVGLQSARSRPPQKRTQEVLVLRLRRTARGRGQPPRRPPRSRAAERPRLPRGPATCGARLRSLPTACALRSAPGCGPRGSAAGEASKGSARPGTGPAGRQCSPRRSRSHRATPQATRYRHSTGGAAGWPNALKEDGRLPGNPRGAGGVAAGGRGVRSMRVSRRLRWPAECRPHSERVFKRNRWNFQDKR